MHMQLINRLWVDESIRHPPCSRYVLNAAWDSSAIAKAQPLPVSQVMKTPQTPARHRGQLLKH
jgi:hypothetical protein